MKSSNSPYAAPDLYAAGPDHDDFAADRGSIATNWNQDREAMKNGHWSGLMRNFVYEDFIVEESMGPIADRSQEYLGSSDRVITRFRKILFEALKNHERGELPFGLGGGIDYSAIRALAIRYPGLLLYSWFNIPPKAKRITPGFDMAKAWTVSTGTRPPSDLRRHRPSYFLGDCQFRAAVRTVGQDSNQVKRAEEASYSRVDHLIERTEGTPPRLRTRDS